MQLNYVKIMISAWFSFLAMWSTVLIAQFPKEELERGKVLDKVICIENQTYSYALYLPSNYHDSLQWPVIFILEPAARGALATSVFKLAAEKYGYIIACSNDSRNGLFLDNYKIVEIFTNDVYSRFNIDNSRIYFSGFSGGSRVALSVAVLNSSIAGVIGCGAALSSNPEFHPIKNHDFVYIGLVGNRDMNYLEMFDMEEYLTSIKLSNSLRVFEAGHRWPPSETMLDAIEWIEIEAMKKGLQPIDSGFVNMLFEKRKLQTAAQIDSGNLVEAMHQYKNRIRTFKGIAEITEIEQNMQLLEQDKSFKKERKSVEKSRALEIDYRSDFRLAAMQLQILNPVPDSLHHWWSFQLKRLRQMEENKSRSQQLMAARLINMISAMSIEWSQSLIEEKRYYNARELIKLGVELNPDSYYYYYKMAIIEILNNNNEGAFQALESAVENGLDLNWLRSSDFDEIRETDQFKKLSSKL
ncbi:MAG: hypothetical protein DRI54_08885 [Bacteroidetes bacterium]|nr:MAG: hypothetical protein DRI54_08885 [Bacteroidota bacterium]